ncbi:MAG: MFS transporter [Flavobacteriales bacterium]|nr:MFS transporter [Flavobacteriales bacterium]MCC6939441.1 MFS transporter [Flavobacteriales bacterium]
MEQSASGIVKGDRKVIRAWSMYDWANSSYSLTITSAVFPMFYVAVTADFGEARFLEQYGVPSASLYSYALSAGFLLVAMIVPLLSGIADHRGNKLSYLKFFCYLGAASCAGLFFFSVEHIWLSMACIVLACAGFSGSLVFYDAYLPEIAERKDHDRISARGYTMGYIGSVILLIINLLMVMKPGWFGIPDRDGLPARLTFLSVAVWWAGWAQWPFSRLPGPSGQKPGKKHVIWSGYQELRKVWVQLTGMQRLRRYLMAFFVFNMGIQTVMYLAVNFAKQEIKQADGSAISDESLIISVLIIQLVAALGALTFVQLSKRLGNLRALLLGCLIWVGVCAMAWSIHWTYQFYILAALVGSVMGGCQALSRSTYAKFLPATKDTASFFSFYDVSYYVGTVLGTAAYGLVYQFTGDLRNTIIAIGSFFVLGAFLLWRVPKEEVPIPATA